MCVNCADLPLAPLTGVQSRVPQELTLGSVLNFLYINGIRDSASSSIRLFLDNCVLYHQSLTKDVYKTSPISKMGKDLVHVIQCEQVCTRVHLPETKSRIAQFSYPRTTAVRTLRVIRTALGKCDRQVNAIAYKQL